jgi:hypothetical protein
MCGVRNALRLRCAYVFVHARVRVCVLCCVFEPVRVLLSFKKQHRKMERVWVLCVHVGEWYVWKVVVRVRRGWKECEVWEVWEEWQEWKHCYLVWGRST